jgi:hypothetical protein
MRFDLGPKTELPNRNPRMAGSPTKDPLKRFLSLLGPGLVIGITAAIMFGAAGAMLFF